MSDINNFSRLFRIIFHNERVAMNLESSEYLQSLFSQVFLFLWMTTLGDSASDQRKLEDRRQKIDELQNRIDKIDASLEKYRQRRNE
jgi:hypothetical protein